MLVKLRNQPLKKPTIQEIDYFRNQLLECAVLGHPLHTKLPTQFENNHFTEVCCGSEAGSYLRPIDFVYHSTLGVRVIKNKKKQRRN